jgi:hypothetical protein
MHFRKLHTVYSYTQISRGKVFPVVAIGSGHPLESKEGPCRLDFLWWGIEGGRQGEGGGWYNFLDMGVHNIFLMVVYDVLNVFPICSQ